MRIEYRSVGYKTYKYKGAHIIKYQDGTIVVTSSGGDRTTSHFKTLRAVQKWINEGYPDLNVAFPYYIVRG